MKTQSNSTKKRLSGWRARSVAMALFAVVAGGFLAAVPASAHSHAVAAAQIKPPTRY
jgi:hypothetical protein